MDVMGSMEDDRKKRAPEQGDGISPAGKKKNVSLEDVLHVRINLSCFSSILQEYGPRCTRGMLS